MAEFLQAARGRRRHQHRSELVRGADGSALHALRRTSGARVPRWAAADRRALLHERGGDEVRAKAISPQHRRCAVDIDHYRTLLQNEERRLLGTITRKKENVRSIG